MKDAERDVMLSRWRQSQCHHPTATPSSGECLRDYRDPSYWTRMDVLREFQEISGHDGMDVVWFDGYSRSNKLCRIPGRGAAEVIRD
ncbi:hypothetical protein BO78DRAFT_234763 [Aspergillus sclerotiicarbonarius CBS 121057]|uniref:Uncharacterized protein n=1 Tax=Aspergillus sclerotiicarbonarius (strain CBS 121057 / IBT 28362) TaxID=1448318 RepID=A0A319EIP8_ASPSB|nr:hypothetical protein BO78DRAFT_234763 [Aspergillus sclerotiicarbonarius CBS 121057]